MWSCKQFHLIELKFQATYFHDHIACCGLSFYLLISRWICKYFVKITNSRLFMWNRQKIYLHVVFRSIFFFLVQMKKNKNFNCHWMRKWCSQVIYTHTHTHTEKWMNLFIIYLTSIEISSCREYYEWKQQQERKKWNQIEVRVSIPI